MKNPTLGWYLRHDDAVRARRLAFGLNVPPPCPCASGTPGECWEDFADDAA